MPTDYSIELRLAYLRAAYAEQSDEEVDVATYRDFYNGKQGVKLTDRQQEYLGASIDSFGNLCKRVVHALADRLELTIEGIKPAKATQSAFADAVTGWWSENDLHSEQKAIYKAALRDDVTAVIVGWDGSKPTVTPNLRYDGETGLIRFHYDTDGNLLAASKRWHGFEQTTMAATGKMRINLYYDDRIERYMDDRGPFEGWRLLDAAEVAEQTGGLVTANPQPWLDRKGQPLGIPVIPFDTPNGSELADVVTIQRTVNKTLSDFDTAIDVVGWPRMWIAGATLDTNSTSGNKEISNWGPNQILDLPIEGRAGQLDPPDLERMFQSGVLSWVQMIALVKGWPLFVLDRNQQPPSGVALRVMEGALVAQAQSLQAVFGGAWQQAFDMGRKLHRLYTGEELLGEIDLEWEPAATNDELAAMTVKALKWEKANVPTLQRWREAGYTDEDIAQMQADQAEDTARSVKSLAAGMMEQQRQFDQEDTGQEGQAV